MFRKAIVNFPVPRDWLRDFRVRVLIPVMLSAVAKDNAAHIIQP